MAVSFVAANPNQTIPASVAAGDFLILITEGANCAGTDQVATPAGWTLYEKNVQATGPNNTVTQIFTRVAQAGDANTFVSLSPSGSFTLMAGIIALRGSTSIAGRAWSGVQSNTTHPSFPQSDPGAGYFPVYAAMANNNFTGAGNTGCTASGCTLAAYAYNSNGYADLAICYGAHGSGTNPAASITTSGGYAANWDSVTIYVADNSAPNAPTSLSPAEGTRTKSTGSQTVSAVFSDPDGGTGHVDFRWGTDGVNFPNGPYAGSTVASGQASSYTFTGLPTATRIYWNAYSVDSSGAYTGAPSASFYTDYPPSAPTITAPNGGESYNASATITWTAGSDPDGDALTYDLDYSSNNGGSWTSIATGVSGTSYTWNTSALPASAAYLVRARARDPQGLASGYDQSNAVFTVQHNVAPLAPTLSGPANNATLDRGIVQRFSWTFQDPDAGDSQSKFDLQYRVGTGAWTAVSGTTPNTFWDAPAATFAAGSYEWQVRTYDSQGVVGPWSASSFFTAADAPPAPTITGPTSGATIGAANGVVSWSTPSQTDFQVRRVADNAGSPNTSTVYWDSGQVTSSTARDQAVTYETNNRYEHVQVRIKSGGLWSSWASVRVQVSYTPPAVPSVMVSADAAKARLVVTYTQPTPTGTQPTVSSVDIYLNDGTGSKRRAKALSANGSWTFYTPRSDVAYTFRVVAFGANGTSTSSPETA